jgi:hypothetical protein
MKKINLLLISLSVLSFVTSCGDNQVVNAPISELTGAFTYNADIEATFRKSFNDGYNLYCTLYPQTMMDEGQIILYRIDQRLQLNRDYTYNYEYTIILGNPGAWGNLDCAKLHVNINGTFDYSKNEYKDDFYNVHLSNPTSGEEKIYGYHMYGYNIYSWERHAEPDYVLDFGALNNVGYYSYDEYVRARSVWVKKSEEGNIVQDDIFFPFIIDTFGHYSTY